MGHYRMGPPEALVTSLQQRMKLECFVETGTYRGDTAAWASTRFSRVVTIELSPSYRSAATERFRDQANVKVLGGSSENVLGEIIPGLTASALFWLDAHWSGLDTAGREEECPLLKEISLINAAVPHHVVLVDDARLFASPPPRPHRADQWPDLAAVTHALVDSGRRYVALFEDVLIAVPITEQTWVRGFLQDAVTANDGRNEPAKWWKKIWG